VNKAYPPIDVASTYPSYGPPIVAKEDALIDIQKLLQIVRRRFWIMLLVFVLTVAAVTALTVRMTPVYTTSTRVIVDSRDTQIVEGFREGISTTTAAIDTEVQVIRSRTLLSKVVERLQLQTLPEFNPSLNIDPNAKPGLVDRAKTFVKGILPGGSDETNAAPAETEAEKAEREFQTAVSILGGKVNVTRVGATYIIDILATSESPTLAAQIADTVAKEYEVDQLNAKFEANKRETGFLEEKLSALREEVRQAESAVTAYMIAYNLTDAEGNSIVEQEITRVTTDLTNAEAELAAAQARLTNVRSTLARGGSTDSVAEVLGSAVIGELRRQQAEIARQRAELSSRYGPRHPEILRISSEAADINAQISAEMGRIVSSLEGEVDVAESRVRSLRANQSRNRSNLARDNRARVALGELEREAESKRLVYQRYLETNNEQGSSEKYAQADARILSTAAIPTSPSFPRTKLNIALGMILGLMLAAGLALLAELMDNYFSTPEDIERMFGQSSIGSIPLLTKLKSFGKKEMSPADYLIANPLSAFAESVRNLRASIIFADLDKESKTVSITSSLPDEGKTSMTYCLGRMSAMSGARTIIIDGDFRRRQLTEVIGFEPERGFIEHLFGEVTLEEATYIDEQTGLHILPLTNARNTPRDVFGSKAFDALVESLKDSYDLIVIDTGPILLMAESRVVASKTDQVIVVAKWRSTSRWTVQETLKILNDFNANIAGIAMTFVDMSKRKKHGYGGATYDSYSKYYTSG
jgi:exopolysaccharide transport family protein